MLNMERANGTVALYQRDHRSLIDWAARTILATFGFVFIRFLPANVGFINFNHLVLSAQSLGHLTFSHCFANAVHHEPSSFVTAAHHALHLQGADAFLAGIDEIDSKAPFVERNFATLANCVHGDSELLTA